MARRLQGVMLFIVTALLTTCSTGGSAPGTNVSEVVSTGAGARMPRTVDEEQTETAVATVPPRGTPNSCVNGAMIVGFNSNRNGYSCIGYSLNQTGSVSSGWTQHNGAGAGEFVEALPPGVNRVRGDPQIARTPSGTLIFTGVGAYTSESVSGAVFC